MTDFNELRSRDISEFPYQEKVDTRWSDNDIYGHLNNIVYLSLFDSMINRYLIKNGGLQPESADVVGYMVHTEIRYFHPVAYPAQVELAMGVESLSAARVTYLLGLYCGQSQPASLARMTHAFVSRETGRPAAIPVAVREALSTLKNDN